MSSANQIRILEQARPATSELDRLIFQMEQTLGKPHTVSPFIQLYAKYGISTSNANANAGAAAPQQLNKQPAAAAKDQQQLNQQQQQQKLAKAAAAEGGKKGGKQQ